MQFLVDLGFWHSVEEAWTGLFPTQSRFICIPEKGRKITHFDGFWTIIFTPICLILASILFQFIFASFFLSGRVEVKVKAHARVAPFSLLRIIAYKISIDLVLLWCKLLVLSPKFWIVLVFLPRSPKIFLDFLPRSWKILQILANLAKNNCQDLGKKCQKSKFLGKKTKTPSSRYKRTRHIAVWLWMNPKRFKFIWIRITFANLWGSNSEWFFKWKQKNNGKLPSKITQLNYTEEKF